MLNEPHALGEDFFVEHWPDAAPLDTALPPVPEFDLAYLPEAFRPLVADISERMQAPPDYPSVALIVALAGCVSRRAVIIPKKKDVSWRVIPNLWGAVIGPPGVMKSPIFRAATLPLTKIEASWKITYEIELENFAFEKKKEELADKVWCEQYKRSLRGKCETPIRPDASLKPPAQKRLILMDSTFEKLHEILGENPAGVLVLRDELAGWLADLERQGRESERSFYLQAWNGDGPFTVDRIGRGSIHVPAVCVSLLGNIQPARLRWYLTDAVSGGPGDDGLFQRFQILAWPDLPPDWKLIDRPASEAALAVAESVFSKLAELSAEEPIVTTFTPSAQELFYAWWPELEVKVRGSSLASPLVAHFSKYRSLMPSLAGLFELADRAGEGSSFGPRLAISLDHARQAAALCDFFEQHARRVYSCLISPQIQAAHELARHIKAGDLGKRFTTRNVYLKGWTGLDSPEPVLAALEYLEDAGWVRKAEPEISRNGGRPSEAWMVNPKVVVHVK